MKLIKAVASFAKHDRMATNCGLLTLTILLFYRLPFWFGRPLLISGDQAAYMHMAKLMLAGQTPYLQFCDFNPPLIIYLSVLPNFLGAALKLPLPLAFNLSVWLLMLTSTALIAWIFYQNKTHSESKIFFPILIAMAAFSQLQFFDYGQREHLFVLCYLPYLITRLLRTSAGKISPTAAILCGLLGGLGICLKPQFALTAFAVELALAISRRTLRQSFLLEIKILLAVGLVYLGHFALYPAAALQTYLTETLPIYSCGKGFFANSFIYTLSAMPVYFLPYYLLGAGLFLSFALPQKSKWLMPLIVFTLVSLVSFLQASTNWTYRGIPMQAGSLLILIAAASSWRPKQRISNLLYALLAVATAVFAADQLALHQIEKSADRQISLARLDIANDGPFAPLIGDSPAVDVGPVSEYTINHTRPEDAVVYIGIGVRPAYPAALIADRPPGSRYLFGMILPMVYDAQRVDSVKFSRLEAKVIEDYGADIARRKPRLIYIENFYAAPRLATFNFEKRFLQDYINVGQLDGLAKIYQRR